MREGETAVEPHRVGVRANLRSPVHSAGQRLEVPVFERIEVTKRDSRLARDLLQRQPAALARVTQVLAERRDVDAVGQEDCHCTTPFEP